MRSAILSAVIMRAVRVHKFGKPEVLKVDDDVPIPKAEENQVLLRVKSAAVNPVDTYIRGGTYTVLPQLPYIVGREGSGTVEEVGPGVQNVKKGDRVFFGIHSSGPGITADYTVCDKDWVFPLSEKLSYHQGAALCIAYFTAYRALVYKGRAKSGETLLVHGASGGVGIAAVQIGKALGLTVVGTAGTREGMDLVTQMGAEHVFCHREKGYLKSAVAVTGGSGFDVILENLANVNLGSDLTVLNLGARVIVVGSRGTVEINPRFLMTTESQIIGMTLFKATKEEIKEMGRTIVDGIEAGWVNPVVDREYSMNELPQAHEDIINSNGAKGKLVVKVS